MGNTFGKKKKRKCLMFGLRNSGKTTILYKLKLGEVVTTISTFGLNVESLEYKKINLNVYDIGYFFHKYDLYNPENLKKIDEQTFTKWTNYKHKHDWRQALESVERYTYNNYDTKTLFQNTTALIFVIDANNRYKLTHSCMYATDETKMNDLDEIPGKPTQDQMVLINGYCRNAMNEYKLTMPNELMNIILIYYVSTDHSVIDLIKEIISLEEFKNVPILFLNNKYDLPNAVSNKTIVDMLDLKNLLKSRIWYLQSCCAITGAGLYQALDYLCDVIKRNTDQIEHYRTFDYTCSQT
eukprot:371525_1